MCPQAARGGSEMILTKDELESRLLRHHTAWESDFLDTIADLERQRDTWKALDIEANNAYEEMKVQRDTTHTAAIQAAADELTREHHKDFAIGVCRAREVILNIIPINAQRLYDLRIAEAVLIEAEWWKENHGARCDGNWNLKARKRLASASAEVER